MSVLMLTHPHAKAGVGRLADQSGNQIEIALQIKLFHACRSLGLDLARQELPTFADTNRAPDPEDINLGPSINFISAVQAIDESKNWWTFIARLSEFDPQFQIGDWVGLFVHRENFICFIGIYPRLEYRETATKVAGMTADEWHEFMSA